MYKKILLGVLASTSLLFAKDINIAVVTHGSDTDAFWSVVKNGVVNAQKETGVNVDYRNPASGDLTEMARLITSAVAKRPDGLVVSIPDANALAEPIEKAIKLGIPVITINAGADFGKKAGAIMHIGQSEYNAGFEAGKKAKKSGVKSFLCVNHEITNISLEERCKGFADALGVKNNMLDVNTDPSEIERKVKPKLKNVDAVLTLGPVGASPTMSAIKKARLGKHIYFVTFDLSKDIIKGIKDGEIDFAIDQQQYLQGYMPIIVLSQYAKYGVLPSGDINSGPGFVTKSNVSSVEKFAGKYR
jgi:simple sugar transport system substrate-binding protein